jgi:hypothetical protein
VARGLGIEIDGDGVRVLAVDGGKRPRIAAFAERAVDPDASRPWAERARDAVKAAVADVGGARGRIVASIDSGDAILRELQLPFTNDEQIRKTVRFELEQHIHNHAIEDLVVDFVKTGTTDKATQLLVAGVPKTVVEERLRLLESAGADPALLDLDALALFNAFVAAGAVTDDAPLLVLYGGARFTKFLLIENGRPRAIRTIRYSAAPPGEATPSVKLPEKEETAAEKDTYVIIDQAAPVDILALEAGRFLMASAATATPSRIYVTGNLDPAEVSGPLTEATGVPVESFDLLAKFAHSLPAVEGLDRRIPVALGLALKAVDRDASGTDFRREEYSYAKKFETVKSSALVLVDLVLMFLALVALHLHFKAEDLRRDTDTVLGYQAQVVADAVEHDPTKIPPALRDDPSKSLDFLKKKIDELAQEVGAGAHPIERSTLNLLSRIWKTLDQYYRQNGTRKIGEQAFYFLVDAVNATQDPARGNVLISMSGVASNIQCAENFRQMLASSTPFSSGWEVESGRYQPDKDNTRFTFTLRKGKQ